ncbi:MAG: hypothetical protein RL375_2482 [Pseudomonadota bacterium]
MTFSDNGLVAQLGATDQALLRRRCQLVELAVGDLTLAAQGGDKRAYFLAGHEGAVGMQYAVGSDTGIFTPWVQSAGMAWCIDGEVLRLLTVRRPAMLLVFSRYIWSMSQDVAALAACAQICDIPSRLAGWIVMSDLRSRGADLHLTHAHLAQMLGVRRAGVTTAALEMKQQGLIDYQRGRIRLLDRAGLEALSCWLPARLPAATP